MKRERLFFFMLVPAVLVLVGCSGAGYLIGSFIDRSNEMQPRPLTTLKGLTEGDSIEITQMNNTRIAGVYRSTRNVDYPETRERMMLAGTVLPQRGEKIILYRPSPYSNPLDLTFIGFSSEQPALRVCDRAYSDTTNVPFAVIDSLVEIRGTSISGDQLTYLHTRGFLTQVRLITICVDTANVDVGTDEIKSIAWGSHTKARWTGFWIGAGVDVAVVVTAAILLRGFSMGGLGGSWSGFSIIDY